MLNYLEECGGIQEEGILRICGETNRMRVWSGGFVQIQHTVKLPAQNDSVQKMCLWNNINQRDESLYWS